MVSVKHIEFIPCIEKSKPSKGLIDVLSKSLFTVLLIDSSLHEVLFEFLAMLSKALTLFKWHTPEYVNPPISPPARTIAAFWTGGRPDFTIVLLTAVETPTIVAPEPHWLPSVLIPLDNSVAAFLVTYNVH